MKGGACATSPRVKAHRLRLYEKVKEFCLFRVIYLAVPDNVPTIYLFHSALFVHFNHNGVYTSFLGYCIRSGIAYGSRHVKPTHNEKALSTGLRAMSFL